MESLSSEIINTRTGATEIAEGGSSLMNLKELKVGEAAQIVGFSNHDDTVKKIEAMGLRKGKRIAVLRKLGRGILIKTNNSRIVITSDVAKNIEVK
jgi:ferrous iron transport protein A